MAAIAARTSTIRIGSAGVMLPHYSALKVAEQFRVLEALAPGRIDLGVGRAPGGDMRTARALNPNAADAAEDFPVQVRDLQAWTSVGRHAGITAHPLGPHAPEIWILGSSDYGAQLAAHFGLPYAFAYFFTDGQGAEQAISLYRRLYQPSERHPEPQATLCIWALVAASDEEARASRAVARSLAHRSRPRRPRAACSRRTRSPARGFDAAEEQGLASMRARAFVGSARDGERGDPRASPTTFELDEVVINTWAHDPGGAANVVRAARRGVLAQRGAEPYVKRRQRYSSGP